MKETFYFSHDYNTRSDSKIKQLLAKHGMRGYGIFWAIIEDLYNNTNVLPLNYKAIAYDLRTHSSIIESIINEFNLFVIDGENFGSMSVEKRLNQRQEKSQNARKSILSRWNKVKDNTTVLQSYNDSNTIKESKEKKIKVKDIHTVKNFIPPPEQEVIDFAVQNGETIELGKKIYVYYSLANWHDSNGKPVKNWKQKVYVNWLTKNKDKNKDVELKKEALLT